MKNIHFSRAIYLLKGHQKYDKLRELLEQDTNYELLAEAASHTSEVGTTGSLFERMEKELETDVDSSTANDNQHDTTPDNIIQFPTKTPPAGEEVYTKYFGSETLGHVDLDTGDLSKYLHSDYKIENNQGTKRINLSNLLSNNNATQARAQPTKQDIDRISKEILAKHKEQQVSRALEKITSTGSHLPGSIIDACRAGREDTSLEELTTSHELPPLEESTTLEGSITSKDSIISREITPPDDKTKWKQWRNSQRTMYSVAVASLTGCAINENIGSQGMATFYGILAFSSTATALADALAKRFTKGPGPTESNKENTKSWIQALLYGSSVATVLGAGATYISADAKETGLYLGLASATSGLAILSNYISKFKKPLTKNKNFWKSLLGITALTGGLGYSSSTPTVNDHFSPGPESEVIEAAPMESSSMDHYERGLHAEIKMLQAKRRIGAEPNRDKHVAAWENVANLTKQAIRQYHRAATTGTHKFAQALAASKLSTIYLDALITSMNEGDSIELPNERGLVVLETSQNYLGSGCAFYRSNEITVGTTSHQKFDGIQSINFVGQDYSLFQLGVTLQSKDTPRAAIPRWHESVYKRLFKLATLQGEQEWEGQKVAKALENFAVVYSNSRGNNLQFQVVQQLKQMNINQALPILEGTCLNYGFRLGTVCVEKVSAKHLEYALQVQPRPICRNKINRDEELKAISLFYCD